MSNEEDYFKIGQAAARYFYSPDSVYRGMGYHGRPDDIFRLFLPPVEEQMIQMTTPLPKPRQKWLAGFKKETAKIFNPEEE